MGFPSLPIYLFFSLTLASALLSYVRSCEDLKVIAHELSMKAAANETTIV